jgi:5-methylcytosine-specific restriction protein A
MPSRPPTLNLSGRELALTADTRPAPSRRGYGRMWQACRLQKLADDPWCEHCLADGLHVAATEVDHKQTIRSGGEVLDRDNLQSLCKPCHSRKTAAEDGGFGRSIRGES